MHGTTSPFYPLIASLDVAAAMMDEPAGPTLMDETLAGRHQLPQGHVFHRPSPAHRRKMATAGSSASSSPSRSPIPTTGETHLFEEAADELARHRTQLLDPQARRRLARLPGRRHRRRLLHARPHQGHHPHARRQRPGQCRRLGHPRSHPHRVPRRPPRRDRPHRRLHRSRALLRRNRPRASGAACSKISSSSSASTTPTLRSKRRSPNSSPRYPNRYRNVTLKELCDEMHAAMIELNLPGLVERGLRRRLRSRPHARADLPEAAPPRDRKESASPRWPAASPPSCSFPTLPGIPMSMPGERLGGADSPGHPAHPRHGGVRQALPRLRARGPRHRGRRRGQLLDAQRHRDPGKKRNGNGKQRPPSSAPPIKKPAAQPRSPPHPAFLKTVCRQKGRELIVPARRQHPTLESSSNMRSMIPEGCSRISGVRILHVDPL